MTSPTPSRLATRALAAYQSSVARHGRNLNRRSLVFTGYFGRPGGQGGRVHIALVDGSAACGTRQSGSFQYCASRVVREYLECGHCLKLADEHAQTTSQR